MATYNSEKFIVEQIESLLIQTQKNWTLYINDDGSKDSTLNIIDEYIRKYDNKIVNLNLSVQNGAAKNFLSMLNQINSQYYMFCDHDDVWLPNKIEMCYIKMKELETKFPNIPVIIHTDLEVVDQSLRPIHNSLYKLMNINPEKIETFNKVSLLNCVTGCTMMINYKSKIATPPLPKIFSVEKDWWLMHDWWVTINALRSGILSYIPEKSILYRQHDSNTIGIKNVNNAISFRTIYNYNKRKFKILKTIGYGSVFKYIYFRILIEVQRIIKCN